MKLPILVATVAVLALGGVAVAQIEHVAPSPFDAVQPLGSHWTNPEIWDGFDDPQKPFPGEGAQPPALPNGEETRISRQVQAGLSTAVPQMRLACQSDQQSLCADKKSNLSVDRCLEYHRLKLSTPCKQAWDKLTMAAEGRL